MQIECYSTGEVAKMLRISRPTILSLIARGKLKAFSIAGGNLRFTSEDIKEFIESNRKQPSKKGKSNIKSQNN